MSNELTSTNDGFINIISSLATNEKVDPVKLSQILDIQERLLSKQAEQLFNDNLNQVQSKMPRVKRNGAVEYLEDKKDKNSPKVKAFNFARYEDIDEALRPLMIEHGFSISFDSQSRPDGGGLIITGTLSHIGGHSRTSSIPLPLDNSGGKNNLQGMGSTLSYGKRYIICSLFNIVTEGQDDDGVLGAVVFASEDQVNEIKNLIDETNTDISRFMAAYQIALNYHSTHHSAEVGHSIHDHMSGLKNHHYHRTPRTPAAPALLAVLARGLTTQARA